MIPPASNRQLWFRVALAALFPISLITVGLREPAAQAQEQSGDRSTTASDGVYLYGTSPQPNQLARDYVLFERHNDEVIGAFYVPQSEFTCFSGDIEGSQLAVEAVVPEVSEPREVKAELNNLHKVRTISANDHRMLDMCREAAPVR
ncbi:hypothetical protein [Leptolyngbya sp. FACHB-8]|uniref:hypothetical protein n=1 Tax=unclassified Leptolyngbya TaxID=2650499 RepID=UPI0016844CAC|nr:hypothetical protein [Leptolyngbya sp. FACHB-8]MBD1914087.1 hypothetical protein [Leptolyngbya sp. FACHB-8]